MGVVSTQWRGSNGVRTAGSCRCSAAALRPLTGDQHTRTHLGDEATRLHYEIPCQNARCWRGYRSDESKLQTLFGEIARNEKIRAVFAASATDAEITITLDALRYARDTAKQLGLRV